MAAGVEWRQEVGHNDEVSCPANDAACQARIQDFAAQFGTPFWGRLAPADCWLTSTVPVASPSFFNNAYAGANPIYFDTLGLAWGAGCNLCWTLSSSGE